MKNLNAVLVLLTMISCSGGADKTSSPEQSVASEQALAQAIELLRSNMVDPDPEALNKLTFDKLSYGHSGGQVEDKKTFIETLTSGKSDFLKVTFENQTTSIEGNTGIVRFDLLADTHDAGKDPASIRLHILTVWEKDGETWKLLARQAVKI